MAQTEEDVLEYAHATRVRVLETNVLHAEIVVYWLDGASAVDTAGMNRIHRRLNVRFDTPPHDLRVLQKPGQMALWRRPATGMIPGRATLAQMTPAAVSPYALQGQVSDPSGHYNPRRFALAADAGQGVAVLLYPSPLGVALGDSGGVVGSLRFATSDLPAAWALLELVVELSSAQTQSYRAQADRNGDFALALDRLPPLPQGATAYPALLRVRALETVVPGEAPDTGAFVEQELQSGTTTAFATEFVMAVRPGGIQRIQSFNKPHVAVQPA